MILSPKSSFIRSDKARASTHQDRVTSPEFEAAASAAMLEYVSELQLQSAADALRLDGAKRFLDILMSIGDSKQNTFRVPPPTLSPV